ncbi:MAG: BMP family ABC transporter substrate-binding protein, partial [Lachnospiraceae bacterium]|nr:BMP family ABC transporter substrate-binding protein [Lachnospiraceae bacterium]
MKKALSMILAAMTAAALCAGCGNSGQGTPQTQAPAAAAPPESSAGQAEAGESSQAGPETPEPEGSLKAAFITPQALGDGSVTDLSYSGFTRAAEEYGMETQVVEVQVGEYEETLRSMAQEGYGLLVCLQPELVDAVCTVAPEYPDTLFFSMNGEIHDIPNVLGSANKEQEGSYLAGVTAALMSETGKIGAVIGQDMAQNNRYAAGYEDGAKAARPDIQVSILYAGTFEDPAKGKELALTLYNSGYDVVYQV